MTIYRGVRGLLISIAPAMMVGMVDGEAVLPTESEMTATQVERWRAVLGCLVGLLPDGATVAVDGPEPLARAVAGRLASATGPDSVVLPEITEPTGIGRSTGGGGPVLGAGRFWRASPPAGGWDVVIWLRTPPTGADRSADAHVVVDLHDPAWPVIRRVEHRLASADHWYLAESRAFFATKAATWDARFGDDLPAYTSAVAEAELRSGGVVLDVGCGTGRALPGLRIAVGPAGTVIGLDLTPEMLGQARARSRAERAPLVLADACRLPFATASADGVFAAGLLMHLPTADAGLRELARVTRPGGRLVLFHPTGRAALAARHGRTLRPDEALAEGPLRASTQTAGWRLDRYDDAAHRFLAVAVRR